MKTVVVLALEGVLAFDLSTPVEVFGRARLPGGRAAYRVRVCAPTEEVDAGVFSMRVPWGLEALAGADTIVLPGLADPTVSIPKDILAALRAAADGGTRIASICVGAFTLAATGLLDGRRATTHWAAARELARLYPEIDVDADVLFVDNGQILTSAGAAAGLDLCLHMIRQDHGSAVAADAARVAVMPLERDGGQAQPRRTANQTLRGIYWAYDGASGLGTPPRMYNQIVRKVAENIPNPDNPGGEVNTPEQNARLFALLNVAMGDAGILAWDQKYIHDLWRPVVGIREHDESTGPAADQGENTLDPDCQVD
ncbi:MAG: DJ-1/PfpI family protein, partial [Actinomycetota bacterium]|nr:DJ-1/PfpI family protein [Actinomycetota bacterium]